MRIRLKGLNSRRKTLADGSVVTYYYAWKGGPRLTGEPGSPEFIASYHEAVSTRRAVSGEVLQSVLDAYQQSGEFNNLADRTRADYVKHIRSIEKAFGDFPVAALKDRRARGLFLGWRDKAAMQSRRQADYAFTVLARSLSWALNRGMVDANPCEKAGRLYRGSRAEKVWTAEDEAAFLAAAPAHIRLAFMLALWTGQRQGDLLALPWSAYNDRTIRLRQSKTGTRLEIPVGGPLRAVLDATPRRSTIILTNMDGKPWTEDGFRSSWRKACARAEVRGVTFHDLRGTAVTRLAVAGATEAEIATFTGHSLRDVRSILDTHYLARDPALAAAAILKLERGTNSPD